MTAKATKRKCKMWVNNGYDFAMWYSFELQMKPDLKCRYSIGIYRNYDIAVHIKCNDVASPTNTGMPASNQVEIVKCLIEWGFVL